MHRPTRISRARALYEESLSQDNNSSSGRYSSRNGTGQSDVPTYKVSLGKQPSSTDPYAYFTPRGSDYVYDSKRYGQLGASRYRSSVPGQLREGWVSETISYSRDNKNRYDEPKGYEYKPRSYRSSKYYSSENTRYDDEHSPSPRRYEHSSSRKERHNRNNYGVSSSPIDFPVRSRGGGRYGRESRKQYGKQNVASPTYSKEQHAIRNSPYHMTNNRAVADAQRYSNSRRGSTPFRQEIYKLVTEALNLQDQGRFEEAREIINVIEDLQQEAESSHVNERVARGELDESSPNPWDTAWKDTVNITDVKRDAVVNSRPSASQQQEISRSPIAKQTPVESRELPSSNAMPAPAELPPSNIMPAPAELPPSNIMPAPAELPPSNIMPAPAELPPSNIMPAPAELPPSNIMPAPAELPPSNIMPAPAELPPSNIMPAPAELPPSNAMPAPVDLPASTSEPKEMPLDNTEPEPIDVSSERSIPDAIAFSPIIISDDTPVETTIEKPNRPRKASVVLDQVHAERMLEAVKDTQVAHDEEIANGGTVAAQKAEEEIEQLIAAEEEDEEEEFDGEDEMKEDQISPANSPSHANEQPSKPRSNSLVRDNEIKQAEEEYGVPLILAPPEEEEIFRTLVTKSRVKKPLPQSKTSGGSKRSTSTVSATNESKERPLVMLTKEGYMRKSPPQGRRFARWRDRYFILSGRLLLYFKSPSSKVPQGIINLDKTTVTALRIPKQITGSRDHFEVRIALADCSRTHRLKLDTESAAVEWTVAITNNIKVAALEGDVAPEDKYREASTTREERPRSESKVGWDITELGPEDEKLWCYYSYLNVSATASPGQIKKNYYKLARDFHPDKNPDADPERFAEINKAFQTLKEEKTREDYDMCERVKSALRRGVVVDKHELDGTINQVALFLDPKFLYLYWQPASDGSILGPEYESVELRFVQQIFAGHDGFDCPPGRGDYCLALTGERMTCDEIRLELDTPAARDEILDGMRLLRIGASMLFKQKLDEMRDAGMR